MKTVFIMRGISGSGKSSMAAKLATPGAICSADTWFMGPNGYSFRQQDLAAAHGECLRKFIQLVFENVDNVVVDNTNLREWEYISYLRIARMAGYVVEFYEFIPPLDEGFTAYVTECAGRNTHGLDYAACKRQATAFQKRIT